mmetsp:Transcript_5053/g.16421  ORF Transcript_5053/g.16421 Transcript_5053/m.16421 type:complete len:98 (-) Transcript_5053:211-504(-)
MVQTTQAQQQPRHCPLCNSHHLIVLYLGASEGSDTESGDQVREEAVAAAAAVEMVVAAAAVVAQTAAARAPRDWRATPRTPPPSPRPLPPPTSARPS